MNSTRSSVTAIAFLCATALANAQDGPGIAFVQAPEQSSGVCVGDSLDQAFACATSQCVAGGAEAQDCLKTNWCSPAGGSIDFFVQHQEGIHWHEVHCGMPTRASAEAAVAGICNRADRDYIIECALVQVYDEQGNPQLPL
jgi:hypothetical protein